MRTICFLDASWLVCLEQPVAPRPLALCLALPGRIPWAPRPLPDSQVHSSHCGTAWNPSGMPISINGPHTGQCLHLLKRALTQTIANCQRWMPLVASLEISVTLFPTGRKVTLSQLSASQRWTKRWSSTVEGPEEECGGRRGCWEKEAVKFLCWIVNEG